MFHLIRDESRRAKLARRCFSVAHALGSYCIVLLILQSSLFGTRAFSQTKPKFNAIGNLGISLAGPEFGDHKGFSNRAPGLLNKDFVFPDEATVKYFASHQIDFIRLPIRWERLQPTLGGKLNESYLNQVISVCNAANRQHVFVIVDLHNYGRYRIQHNGKTIDWIIDQKIDNQIAVSKEHFADLWRRVASRLAAHPAVIGYGLMNEPNNMGSSNWKSISQAAVDSIRSVDQQSTIFVAGEHWSSAEKFSRANGSQAWINDQADRTYYEGHLYFDRDSSGQYQLSFSDENKRDSDISTRGKTRIKPFLNWCKTNKVNGFLGEVGCPADTNWKPLLKDVARACSKNNVPVCYWAAGPWWGDYPLSVQPESTNKSFTDKAAPQLQWLISAQL